MNDFLYKHLTNIEARVAELERLQIPVHDRPMQPSQHPYTREIQRIHKETFDPT